MNKLGKIKGPDEQLLSLVNDKDSQNELDQIFTSKFEHLILYQK